MSKRRTAQPPPFYEVEEQKALYVILRNGRPLMTPAGAPYKAPSRALAEAIAQEWRARQDGKVIPSAMPMTQMMATAFDVVERERAKEEGLILAYAQSDLLCHQAEGPSPLLERQRAVWNPFLDWATTRFGARLNTGCGVMPIAQPVEAVEALGAAIKKTDSLRLTGLKCAVDAAGSLILGLALMEGSKDAEAVWTASTLDATYQAERWGTDPVTQERHAGVLKELKECERWFGLLTLPPAPR